MTTKILIALYLTAIVAANLAVAAFGPVAVIPNSFALIALDLTARDRLHETWHGDARKLGALIFAGSALSAVLDYRALPIAVASFCAFALSGLADTLVYARLARRGWYAKVNGSNAVSAAVDSLAFLSILAALGGLPFSLVPALAAGQWAAKVAGGALWSWLLARRRLA